MQAIATLPRPLEAVAGQLAVGHPSEARTKVRRCWEIWALAVLSAILYVVVAIWMRYSMHYAIGDSLARTAGAEYVLFSRDPHLAALGSVWLPLPTFIQIPFVLFLKPFGQVELAGPVSTALCTVATTLIIVRLCRLLDLGRAATFAIALAWAANPVIVFYAANGMSEASSFVFVALMMLGYLGWVRLNQTSYLVILAMGLAGAVLVRYEALGLVPVMALLAAGERKSWRHSLSTILVVALPAVGAFTLWVLSSLILRGDAFYWLKADSVGAARPTYAAWLPSQHDVLGTLVFALRWTIIFGPVLVVLVLMLARRGRTRGTLGILVAAGVFPMTHFLLLLEGKSWGIPRYFATAALFAAVAAAWLASAGPGARWLRMGWQAAIVAVLLLGAITGPIALTSPVATADEAEARIFGSFNATQPQVGVSASEQNPDRWRTLAADLDPELAHGKTVLVDTTQGFPVVLFSHYPSGFVIPSDGDFQSILADPTGRVDYALTFPQALASDVVGQASGPGWVLVRDYGFARLYRVPSGHAVSALIEAPSRQ
jgi:Dolichyl-phosphate-mannose-protein mannosyltransferase